jgi:hypothetical protein
MPPNQKFGLLFSAIFSTAFFYFQIKSVASFSIICGCLALLFIFVTLLAPLALEPLNRAWFALSLFLGKIFSPLVLSTIFFILIMPVALITRLFGRDALFLKKRHVSSYWVEKEAIDPDSFKNQI